MNITLEQAYDLYEKGYSLKVDADLEEVIIDDDEKEYQIYKSLQSLEAFKNIDFSAIGAALAQALKNMCTTLGHALIKIGGEK